MTIWTLFLFNLFIFVFYICMNVIICDFLHASFTWRMWLKYILRLCICIILSFFFLWLKYINLGYVQKSQFCRESWVAVDGQNLLFHYPHPLPAKITSHFHDVNSCNFDELFWKTEICKNSIVMRVSTCLLTRL